jgi:hypothetical protein
MPNAPKKDYLAFLNRLSRKWQKKVAKIVGLETGEKVLGSWHLVHPTRRDLPKLHLVITNRRILLVRSETGAIGYSSRLDESLELDVVEKGACSTTHFPKSFIDKNGNIFLGKGESVEGTYGDIGFYRVEDAYDLDGSLLIPDARNHFYDISDLLNPKEIASAIEGILTTLYPEK